MKKINTLNIKAWILIDYIISSCLRILFHNQRVWSFEFILYVDPHGVKLIAVASKIINLLSEKENHIIEIIMNCWFKKNVNI